MAPWNCLCCMVVVFSEGKMFAIFVDWQLSTKKKFPLKFEMALFEYYKLPLKFWMVAIHEKFFPHRNSIVRYTCIFISRVYDPKFKHIKLYT